MPGGLPSHLPLAIAASSAHAPNHGGGLTKPTESGSYHTSLSDTKSSSGTFLNHMRLSPANQESRPHQLKDGDILQLVEVGREWQAGANAFNTTALKNLKNLAAVVGPAAGAPTSVKIAPTAPKPSKLQIPDCCVCLFAVTIRQALFIAPCSHTFHYKCIRPLIEAHHPAFSCPLCSTFADLDEDVEVETPDMGEAEEGLSLFGRQSRRAIEREREREQEAGGVSFNTTVAQHVQMDDEMDEGIIVQAEEGGQEEEPGEAEEIEMVDAIEYGGPCEESAMGDDHAGIVHVVAVPVDASLAELALRSPGAGVGGTIGTIDSINTVGSGTAAGSIGSKRKR
ncbi:hypothetical protein JOM56_009705 [Amanita muscaria]